MSNGRELPRISLTRSGIETELSRVNLSQAGDAAYNRLVDAIEDHAARQCTRHIQAHDVAANVVDAVIDHAVAGRTIPEIVAGLTKDLNTTGPR
jgi:hypothetical protein